MGLDETTNFASLDWPYHILEPIERMLILFYWLHIPEENKLPMIKIMQTGICSCSGGRYTTILSIKIGDSDEFQICQESFVNTVLQLLYLIPRRSPCKWKWRLLISTGIISKRILKDNPRCNTYAIFKKRAFLSLCLSMHRHQHLVES